MRFEELHVESTARWDISEKKNEQEHDIVNYCNSTPFLYISN